MQDNYVIAKIESEKHNRRVHLLGRGYELRGRNLIVSLQRACRLGLNRSGSARLGGIRFIR